MNSVEVYTAPGCTSCRMAKAKLTAARIPFVTIDISNEDQPQTDRIQHALLGHKVPQIYVGTEYVGGYTELTAELETGVFLERLQRNRITQVTSEASMPNTEGSCRSAKGTCRYLTPSDGEPLNSLRLFGMNSVSVPKLSALGIATELQNSALRLLDQFASENGRSIDYHRMSTSLAFHSYVELSCRLQNCDLQQLASFTHEEKVAFWANLYNALIVHAKCVLADQVQTAALPPQSPEAVTARNALYSGRSGAVYRIGGASGTSEVRGKTCYIDVTPDIIEHAILRANRPHPSQVNEALTKCASDDARSGDGDYFYRTLTFLPLDHPVVRWGLSVQHSRFDPRIHFVLNCGARSCPPIRVLTACPCTGSNQPSADAAVGGGPGGNVEAALATAAAAYLSEEVCLDEENRTLHLPRLLLWYDRDFGSGLSAVVASVASLLSPAESALSERLRALASCAQFTVDAAVHAGATDQVFLISYNTYDWTSNNGGV